MASVLDIIKHYQTDIEKHSDDETKVLRCINKLFLMKVTVQHLQETGVGRTVNALRKEPGEVGQAARALVLKWKTMVAAEESDQEGEHRNDTSKQNGHGSGRDSDDYSQHSRHTHDRQSSSKNSTPKSNYQEMRSNHQEVSRNQPEMRLNEQEMRPDHEEHHREINGNHSGSKRKYHSSEEDDHDTKKNTPHASSSEDDRKKQIVKQEKLSDSESSNDDSESSDSDTDSYTSESSREEVKVDIKQIKKEKESPDRHESSSHSSKHSSNHHDRKKESSSKRPETSEKDRHSQHAHKSSKDVPRRSSESSKSSSHKHNSSREKESSSDKRHKSDTSSDEKKESKSSKHSSDKHKSSSPKHSSSDRHRSSDKHSSKENKSSSHTDKASEKHKSSSEKDSKHKSRESSSSSKEKNSSSKEKSKERSSSSKERSSHSSEKKRSSSESKSHSDKSKHKSDDRSSEKKSKEKSSSSSSHKSKSSSSSKSKEEVPKKKSKLSSEESGEDGIDCGSGASFAEALGMIVSPSKPKKKSFKDINSPNNSFSNDLSPAAMLAPSVKLAPLPQIEISALPEISPNYKPRPPLPKTQFLISEDDAISAGISSKNQRTKVYSGNKVIGKIPTLYEMCVHLLQEHIDALEFTGGVPYDILKPVIDRSTPQQLFTLEHYNPYLMEDTDHLWQKFCEKGFRNKRRQEMESWREMYIRCQEEQESKLKSLTANIRLTQEAKKAPIKQTKMAYVDSVVKPPRNIARKQALHGTAFAASASPAARVASLAATPGLLKGGRAAPLVIPGSASFKPKKAPLMQKALQFMRGRKR